MSRFVNTTTCFILRDNKVLLQKRAPGRRWAGILNGPGGKVELDESPLQAVVREVAEETALQIHEPVAHGAVRLAFKGQQTSELLIHIFSTSSFSGRPRGVEGSLRWYPRERLPFARMWPDQRYWLPLVLAGGHLDVTCLFDEAQFTLETCELHMRL